MKNRKYRKPDVIVHTMNAKPLRVLCVLFVLLVFQPIMSHAQLVRLEDFLPEQARLPEPIPYPSLVDLPEAIQKADTRQIAEILSRIEAYADGLQTRRLPEYATALWQAGYYAYSINDRALAEQLWESAIRFDPMNVRFYLSLSKYYFSRGRKYWDDALATFFSGLKNLWIYSDNRPIFNAFLMDLLANVIMWVLVGLGILSLIKFFRPFHHDLWERLGARTDTYEWTWGLVFILLGLPLLFVGFVWGAIWWLFLFFFYLSRGNRVGLIGIVLAMLILIVGSHFSYVLYERNLHVEPEWLGHYLKGDHPTRTQHELYYIIQQDPKNILATLAYASYFTRTQQYENALNVYTRAIRAGVDSPAVWMNLGNLFYLQELPRQALLFYKKAEEMDIQDSYLKSLLLYNEGKAYHAILEFSKGENLIQEAFRMNPNLTRMVTETTMVFDYIPDENALKVPPLGWVIRNTLKNSLIDSRVILIFLYAIIATVLYIIRWPSYRAEQCERCGDAYCSRCSTRVAAFPYCNACTHLFILRDGISPSARNRKLKQIEVYNYKASILRNLVRLVIPGGGPFYIEKRLNGLFIMFPVALFITLMIQLKKLGPWWLPSHLLPVPFFIGLIGLVLIYLLNGIYVLIRKV